MKAVFLKELRQYWNSLIGAVFLAAYALMIGYQFYVGNLLAQNGSVSRLFESVLSMLMFFIPILTMRLFAEEKKMHTDQLVFTAPVSDAQIMAGKFGAAWLVFGVGSLPLLWAVCVMAGYGCFQGLTLLGNFTALCLAGALFIAIGMLVSACTENQVVAAIVSYVILLGMWSIGYLQAYLPQSLLLDIIRYMSYRSHIQRLASGVFDCSTFVYFVSLTALCLGICCEVLKMRRDG